MGQTKEREIAILPGRSLTIFAYVCLYTENGRCPYFFPIFGSIAQAAGDAAGKKISSY